MSAGRAVRGSLWAGLACVALGCSAAHARPGAALFGVRDRSEARERVFSVVWWAQADATEGLPYRPMELGSPAVDPQSGTVFVGTSDGLVHALAAGGRELWRWEGRGAIDAGPTLVDGVLYVATTEGKLVALGAKDGQPLWQYDSGEELVTAPAVSENAVYVRSSADTLFAVDRQTGKWRWQYRREPPGQFTIRTASRPLAYGDKVYAGFADGFAAALDARDGSIIWARQIGTGSQFIDVDAGPILDTPVGGAKADPFADVAEPRNVLFAAYSTGIFALDLNSGAVSWSVKRSGITTLALGASGRRVFGGGTGFVGGWSVVDGAPSWRVDLGADRVVSGLAEANGYLLAATGEGPLMFLDERTGRVRRVFNPGRGIAAAPTTAVPGEATLLSNRGYVYQLAIEGKSR